MKEKLICCLCGAELTEETVREFDGQFMCTQCFDIHTVACDCCGERIWSDDTQGD